MKYINLLSLISLIFISCTLTKPVSSPVGRLGFKDDFLRQINKIRRQGCNCGSTYMPPAPPLTWNDQLALSARNHASDMARYNYFSHNSRNGRVLKDRTDRVGYTLSGYKSLVIGENIARGQRSATEVMRSWISSPGHCKNLMNPAFKEVGVAEVDLYWVQNFGGREPFSKKESAKK